MKNIDEKMQLVIENRHKKQYRFTMTKPRKMPRFRDSETVIFSAEYESA